MQNAYERLKLDTETQAWWQTEVLDDPRFALVIEAAKVLLVQTPPAMPQTTSVIETFALSHAAALGAQAAIAALDQVGAKAFSAERVAAEKAERAKHVINPAIAGTGPARMVQAEKPA